MQFMFCLSPTTYYQQKTPLNGLRLPNGEETLQLILFNDKINYMQSLKLKKAIQ